MKIRRQKRQDNCTPFRLAKIALVLVVSLWIVFKFFFSWGSTTTNNSDSIKKENIVTIHIEGVDQPVHLELYANQTPAAAEYIRNWTQQTPPQNCPQCNTLYRGEPVPELWGDPSLPATWEGGRWGPPYALIQGQFGSNQQDPPPPEDHRTEIQRGMVAWAGGKGGPHFFVALADHPEWGHSHTVFGRIVVGDLQLLENLLVTHNLVTTRPKQPPIISNFEEPIHFTLE